MEQDPKVTPQEFAAKIKAKYPEYKDMDDNELVKKITEKYPTYKDQINFSGEPIKKKSTTEQQPTESPSETTPSAAEQRETVGGSESNTPREFVLGKPEYASDKDKFIQESTQKALDFQKEQKAKQKIQAQNDLRLKSVTEEEINEGIKLADEKISFINNNTEAFSKKLEGLKARAEAGETIPQEEVKNLEFERKILNIAGSAAYTEKQQLLSDRVLKRSATGTFSGAAQNVMTEGWSKITQGGARLGAYLAASILPNEMVSPDLASGEKTRSEVLGELESEFISGEIGRSLSALKDDGTTPEYLARKVEESILAEVAVGVGESLPAMAGGVSSLMLYSTQVGFESVNEAAGDKLTYDQKMAYATTFGVVQGLMEKAGLDIVLNKGVMSKLTNNVIEELFNKGLKSNTKNISSILTEGATPLLRSFSGEAVTGGAQELSAVSLESLSNYLSDEEIFDKQSTSEIVSRVLKGAALEGLGGGMMATPAAIFRAGKAAIKPNGFAVAEEMVQPQNISDIYEYLDARVAAGEMSEADAQQMRLDTKASADIIESIPPEISTEKKVEAFKLIQEKKALEAEIEGKEPALVQDKIDRIKGTKKDGVETKGINQELTDLVQRTDVSNADSQVEPDVAPINDTQVEDAPVLSDTPPQDQQSEASAPISALKDVESTAKALSEHDKNTEDLETAFAVANGNMKSTDLKPSKGRDSLIPIFKKFIAEDKYVGQYRFGIIGVTETISEAYHADKAAGVETELTKAVEALLSPTETQTEATNVATNGVSEAPSQERQLEDIQNGDVISFTYNNESEVPDVFKDKISSKGELNGKKYVRVTVAKSLADYELSKQQPQVRPTEVVTEVVKEKPTKQERKQVIYDKIDDVATELKRRLSVNLPEGTKMQGIDQDGIIDLAASAVKALVSTGIEIQAAVKRVMDELSDMGVVTDSNRKDVEDAVSKPKPKAKASEDAVSEPKPKEKQEPPQEGTKKERRFSARSKIFAEKIGVKIEDSANDFYTVENQAKILDSIKKLDDTELNNVFQDENFGMSTRIAAGIELFVRQISAGEDPTVVRQQLAKMGTDMGQAIAMFASLKTATPEGIMAIVLDSVEQAGRTISNKKPETPKSKPATKPNATGGAFKELADKIRKAKFSSTKSYLGTLRSDPTVLFQVAWDGTLEAFATSLELTGDAFMAAEKAIKFIQGTEWYKGLSEASKKKADEVIKKDLEAEALKNSKVGREINKVRETLQQESQIEKLRSIAEEIIQTQQAYTKIGERVVSGEDIKTREIFKAKEASRVANVKLDRFINAVIPVTWGDILSSTLQGNLLVVKSLIKNPIYNATRATYEIAAEILGESILQVADVGKMIVNAINGKPIKPTDRKKLFSAAAYFHSAKYGAMGFVEAVKKAKDGRGFSGTDFEYDKNIGFMPLKAWQLMVTNTKIGDALNVPRDLMATNDKGEIVLGDRLKKLFEGTLALPAEFMFRVLPFGDTPFYRFYEAMDLYNEAKARNLKGAALKRFIQFPPADAAQTAREAGARATFQEDSKVSQKATAFVSGAKSAFGIPIVDNFVQFTVRTFAPYVKTPVNVISQTADYALPGYAVIKSFVALAKDNDPRKAALLMSKAVLGFVMTEAAFTLIGHGLVTGALYGSGDGEEYKEREFAKTTQPPSTINKTGLSRLLKGEDPTWKEGDEYLPYVSLGVYGAILGMHANSEDTQRRLRKRHDKNPVEGDVYDPPSKIFAAYGNVPEMAKYSMDQSFLSGVNTILNAATGDEKSLMNVLDQFLKTSSSVILPNQLTAINRMNQEYAPNLKGKDLEETFKNVLLDKTFQTDGLPLKYDLAGNAVRNTPEGKNPFIFQILNPFSAAKPQVSPVFQELIKVFKESEDTDVIMSNPKELLDYDGKRYRMSIEEMNNFVMVRQPLYVEELADVFSKDKYINGTTEEKVELIKRAYKYVNGSKEVDRLKKETAIANMKRIKKEASEK